MEAVLYHEASYSTMRLLLLHVGLANFVAAVQRYNLFYMYSV